VEDFRKPVVEILQEKAELPSMEVLRRVREAGYAGGKSALYALVASLRLKERYWMFSESKRAAILELHKQGHGSSRIAQALGASRTTVRYIINSGTVEVPKVLRPNKGEPYRALILELCSSCHGNQERVHKELMAQGAQFSYQALTSFVRRIHLWKSKSDITRSVNAAQEWLAEIIHGARALEILKTQFDDSSDLATLLYSVKMEGGGSARRRPRSSPGNEEFRTRSWRRFSIPRE
jgi:hypothetical protein